MKKTLAMAAALIGTTFAATISQASALATKPDIYVVMFTANWCAPCRVVEPKIQQALGNLKDSSIEYLDIDISSPALSEVGAHKAFDREIVAQYNGWLGVTGFAAIIDADTKRTLGCVNMLYDVDSMATHIRNLKTYAVVNKSTVDLTCPDQVVR